MPVSIQIRQALERLVLPFNLLIAIAIILIGQAEPRLVQAARMFLADIMTPVRSIVAEPAMQFSFAVKDLRGATQLAAENARLRAENETLRGWYDVALSLAQENETLKTNLHWIPESEPSFVTGRVIADAGGLYGHAVLIGAGTDSGIHDGNIALAADGFIGRVTETGHHSARVLLINDTESKIPVTLEASHGSAIMTGDRTPTPRLMYYAQDNHPIEGERVVTGGQIDLLPAGLPVGTVHYIQPGKPVVVPFSSSDHISILRIFNFTTTHTEPPEAPGRIPQIRRRPGMPPSPFSMTGNG